MTQYQKMKKQLEIALEVLRYFKNKKKCQNALKRIEMVGKEDKEEKEKIIVDNN